MFRVDFAPSSETFSADDPSTLDPSRPDAVQAGDEELVDGIVWIHLEDEETSGAESVLRAEGDDVARLDVVLHGLILSCSGLTLH